MCKALELTKQLFSIAESIKQEWKNLNNTLSITDQKRSDIEHFIEINSNLNASQGYKLYRLLKEVLEERRNIKNQMDEIQIILEFVNKTQLINPKEKKSVIDKINNKYNLHTNEAGNRKYKIRVLTEVFGNTLQKEA